MCTIQTIFVDMSMLDMYLHVMLRLITMAVKLGFIQNNELTLGEKTTCTRRLNCPVLLDLPPLPSQCKAVLHFSFRTETMND